MTLAIIKSDEKYPLISETEPKESAFLVIPLIMRSEAVCNAVLFLFLLSSKLFFLLSKALCISSRFSIMIDMNAS
ncbi:hypothetical protein [Tenacibaculum sp. SG-28]|uniref:hypothetical protein n=1 Tax=Tenacibaculum sp. SG-28 TaxID=754426 RepID=UPI003514B205